MKRLSHLALAVTALLAACTGSSRNLYDFAMPNPFEGTLTGPTVTMQLENGQTVSFVVTTKNADLQGFTRVMIDRGYYNDQYIYRDVPGAFVLTGKARLSGRPTLAGPFISEADREKMPSVSTGQVGLLIHPDGTVGPEFILRYGIMIRDRETQPANVAIGKLKEGKDALENAQKGDKVFKVTISR